MGRGDHFLGSTKSQEGHLLASVRADSIQVCLVLGAATNLEMGNIPVAYSRSLSSPKNDSNAVSDVKS